MSKTYSTQRRIDDRPGRAHDLRRGRRLGPLVAVEQLFVQLLTVAPPDDLDRDVALGEADHRLGEVHDPHGVAHVERVHLAALGQRAGADHELDRLRDRHEEARHLRIGHRHRAAGLDLAAEDRDHRARGTEDVAEAHGAVRGIGIADLRGLDGPLGQRLRRAHDRGGRDRLVGRDEHERPGVVVAGDLSEHPRGERVVAHGLDRIALHQLDVLERGGVEHDVRPELGEDLAHAFLVLAVGQDGVG